MNNLFHQTFPSSVLKTKEDFKSAIENTRGLGLTTAGFVVIQNDDIKIVDRGDGMNQAIPLLLWENENSGEIVLNKPALKWLESIDKPIRVISIVGPERSGKSYLLSRMVCPIPGSKGQFKLGSMLHGCTQGIWIYKHDHNEDIATIYMDTQGFGSLQDENDPLKDQDAVLFTLSSLLSSSLIYNSMGQLKRQDTLLLNLMAQYVDMVLTNGEHSKDVHVKHTRPDFFWIVRDCMNKIVDDETKEVLSPIEYYRKFLEKSNVTHQNIFLNSFNSVDLQVICKPCTDKEVLKNVCMYDDTKRVSEEFKTTSKSIIELIKSSTVTKKSPTGSAIKGKEFVTQLCHYVRVLNGNRNFIPIYQIWKVALNQNVLAIADQHLHQYKTEMDQFCSNLPVPEPQLQKKHEETFALIKKSYDALTETYHTVHNLVQIGKTQLCDMILRRPRGEKPGGEKPGGEKPGGEKPGKEQTKEAKSTLPWAHGLYPRYVAKNESESMLRIKEKTKEITKKTLSKFSIIKDTCEQDVHDLFVTMETEISDSVINGHKIDQLPCFEQALSDFMQDAAEEKRTFLAKIQHLEEEKKKQLLLIQERKEEEQKQLKLAEEALALAEKKRKTAENHERLMREKEFDFQAKMELHMREHQSRMEETKLRLQHAKDNQMKDQQEKFERELKDLQMNQAFQMQKLENEVQLLQDRVKYAEQAAEAARKAASEASSRVVYCGCFSSYALVTSKQHGQIALSKVCVGDELLSMDHEGNLVFSPVYFFQKKDDQIPMNHVYVSDQETPLIISDHHLVYKMDGNGAGSYVESKDLSVGDPLLLLHKDKLRKTVVSSITRENWHPWAFVLTTSDSVIVNGVVCSCFEYNVTWQKLSNWDTRLLYEVGLAHLSHSPFFLWMYDLYDKLTEPLDRYFFSSQE